MDSYPLSFWELNIDFHKSLWFPRIKPAGKQVSLRFSTGVLMPQSAKKPRSHIFICERRKRKMCSVGGFLWTRTKKWTISLFPFKQTNKPSYSHNCIVSTAALSLLISTTVPKMLLSGVCQQFLCIVWCWSCSGPCDTSLKNPLHRELDKGLEANENHTHYVLLLLLLTKWQHTRGITVWASHNNAPYDLSGLA